MRIIGGKDYYDGGVMYGVDPLHVLVRDSREVSVDLSKLAANDIYHESPIIYYSTQKKANDCYYKDRIDSKYVYRPVVVFFAGTFYRGIRLMTKNYQTVRYIWDEQTFRDWYTSNVSPYFPKNILGVNLFHNQIVFTQTKVSVIDLKVLRELNASIIYPSEYKKYIVNGSDLESFGFASFLPMHKAFQLLDAWVGGVLLHEPDMITISDADRIAKHGMDKTSFRNVK